MPDGDILIHAGDLTYTGSIIEMVTELNKLAALPHSYKIFVPGNHDWLAETDEPFLKQFCEERRIIYLNNQEVLINGLHIWGSGITPTFNNWALNVNRGAPIKEYWDAIPDSTNILITHGPPKGIQDFAPIGGHVGCEDLKNRIDQLKNLKVHVFGHIHEGYGTMVQNGVQYINASNCTGNYKPTNKPFTLGV